jgi:hypothetical protein
MGARLHPEWRRSHIKKNGAGSSGAIGEANAPNALRFCCVALCTAATEKILVRTVGWWGGSSMRGLGRS